ncbi:MAG: SH3 domain-containing protein, partial [Cyclobacteriaceae bacterium]
MKNLILIVVLSTILWSCSDNKSSFEQTNEQSAATEKATEAVAETPVVEEQDAVCLYDNLSVRAAPADKSKWLTSISLGEVVTYTGEKAIDSVSNNTFLKVKLNGGEEGWTRADFVAIDGKVGTFTEDT